ncbi:MAG: Ig-like domain-containing protein, partial [Mogibacterium sp.]|nr:Ig-like domain-containing protein [Mogibacterium sp.]
KNSWETTNTWITDTQFGTHTVLQKPKLVKLSSNKFLLTWEETDTAYSRYETKMVLLGADGSMESDIKSLPISLSECEPITDNSGRVVWYYTEGSKPMFVRIDPDRLDEAVAAANDSKDINLCSVEVGYDQNTYSGEELKPSVSVSRQGKDLQKGTDYEVAYSNNIEPGTGIVTVTGKGEYTGVVEKGFNIEKAYPNFDYEISQTDIEIGGTAKIDAWGFENAQFTFNSVNKDIASVSEDGTVKGLAEGEAQIEITASETEHYRSGTSYIIVNVSKDFHTMEDVSVKYADDKNNTATVIRKCKVCGHEETVSFTTIDDFSLWYWQTPNIGHGYPDYRQTEGSSISITVDYTEPDDAEDTTLVLESSNPDIMAVNGKSVRFVGTGKVTLKIYAKYRPSVYDTVDFLVVHAYDEGKVTKQATCSEKGQKVYTCSVCGDKYTEELAIDPSNHTGGTYLKGETQETCGEDGYTGDECCSGCDQVITKGKVIPATGNHSFDEGIVTAEPTCKDPGCRTYTCSVCGNSYDEEIPADTSKHEWNSDYTVDDPASCTVDGSESIRCRVCGEAKDTRPIPATGHHFGEWYVVEANTCENDGLEQRDCDYCGLSETRGLDATGHDWEDEKRVDLEPTCEMDGSMSIHCRRCDAVLEGESEVIPALGHDWEEEPSVEIKATCTQDGLKGIHCLRCGIIQEGTDVPIPKTGHKFSTWKTTKAATELAAGQR